DKIFILILKNIALKNSCFSNRKGSPPPAAQCHRQVQAAFSLYIAITSKRLVYSFVSQQGHALSADFNLP
ncbi:MAG: hypothetical protein IIW41_07925, partial [Selenomonadaceae bacterium]|nr:hypothetical protein [Selenomonadaceae bacterium]